MKASEDLFLAISVLQRRTAAVAEDDFAILGLSPSHAFVILQVLKRQGCSPSWVGRQLGLAPSTITRIVEKLERMGLMERRPSGREQSLYATDMAKEMEVRIEAAWHKMSMRFKGIIGEEASMELAGQLYALANEMAKQDV